MSNTETFEDVSEATEVSETDIAIVGMAGRFPKARNLDEFWRNLRDGVEAISFLTREEIAATGLDASVTASPNYVNAASVLDDVEMFDASFFDYLPREAEIMDPQQRFFLECAWEALESAGYDSERFRGAIGVYAGVSLSTYLMNIYSTPGAMQMVSRFQIMIGNDKDHLATRVSYKLNLKGPSFTVQTTCSTSLVAVHLACQSLLNGECDMAMAGGVSIKLPQKTGYLFQEGGISSPDGHCRAFDARAQGTIGGNGVGVVVLKRLADAIEDGDHIHAVVKGSAINNDGSLKVGYTAPSVEGQTGVITEALAMAAVEADTIGYVEAHGTGTTLGDPIEIAALTKAYRASTERKQFCAVGSVKTNVGHLDAAAGVTGLIKTVLALRHKQIPPSLHFEQPNPKIDFQNSPFYVNAALRDWERNGTPRRAGVSSFGIGGTNAHVILEEAPETATTPDAEATESDSTPQLVVLSAKTATALETATDNLAAFIEQHPEASLADVAYTLQVGRRAFKHRRAVVCAGHEDAINALRTRDAARVSTTMCEGRVRPVVLMFPGQGSQYVGMGAELYDTDETFRAEVDACAEILRPHLGLDLRDILYPREAEAERAAERLTQTAITQPALFVMEYASARLLQKWGVLPQAMIGHSIGEYVAATLAGVFSLEDALALVATRGRLMQQLAPGAMLTVALSEEETSALLDERLSLAAVNGAQLCVVAGEPEAVAELEQRLNEQGVVCRRLQTSHAFHSAMMEPILKEFAARVGETKRNAPSIPFVSNVTGKLITAAEATDAGYWTKHLRQTVRFGDGLALLLKEPAQILLETGPGQSLTTLVKRHPQKQAAHVVVNTMPPPKCTRRADGQLLRAVAQLWLEGVSLDWTAVHASSRRVRVPLPSYPFERQRHWVGQSESRAAQTVAQTVEADTSNQPTTSSQPTAPRVTTTQENAVTISTPAQQPAPPPTSVAPPAPMHANGNGHAQPKTHERRTAQETIVAQQLQLMSRQLDVLRARRDAARA